jgi:hypothetical protein
LADGDDFGEKIRQDATVCGALTALGQSGIVERAVISQAGIGKLAP